MILIQRIIYIFNEKIIFIQPIKYTYSANELKLLFNQIVVKYMVNEIQT